MSSKKLVDSGNLESAFGDSQKRTRLYQQELLEESMQRNIIIALDTGSGKTRIAILRMMIEIQRDQSKLCWFMAPTVTLVGQQYSVIRFDIPASVGMISGELEPEQWKDHELWRRVLRDHRIIVSTPAVLENALRNGYIDLGRDIGLLIFDEAHHAIGKSPYNQIMKEKYFRLPPRSQAPNPKCPSIIKPGIMVENVRPMILGLTASPIFGSDVQKAFETIEQNLDSTIRTARINKEELAQHVHQPIFKHVTYDLDDSAWSTNVSSLDNVLQSLDIMSDPWVKFLQKKLNRAKQGTSEWRRADQALSRAIDRKDTMCQKGLDGVSRTAHVLRRDLGAWAADWYVYQVANQVRNDELDGYSYLLSSVKSEEKKYIRNILSFDITEVSYWPADIEDDVTEKVNVFIDCLLEEERLSRENNERFSGLVFVTSRIGVLALTTILKHHSKTKDVFRTGSLVGVSENSQRRNAFLDLTRIAFKDSKQHDALMDFRIGHLNLLICTSVAEEGIDIQSCGCVIRWDPPMNTASWAQSRGRARKKKSTFILMLERNSDTKTIEDWLKLEAQMVDAYNDPSRDVQQPAEPPDDEDPDSCKLENEATGAIVNLDSVTSRLSHFCAVIPSSDHVDTRPLFDLDPPEYVEEWHSLPSAYRVQVPYTGPWGATVVLPKSLPLPKREFGVDRDYYTKRSAYRHAAFEAYKYLHEAGLLNDHLLPLMTGFDVEDEEEVKKLLQEVQKREGITDVDSQINPWLPLQSQIRAWHASVLAIGDLPPLLLLTLARPPTWIDNTCRLLYPHQGSPLHVTLIPTGEVFAPDDARIAEARSYTRQLFWPLCMTRMSWDDTDYCYLLLPRYQPDSFNADTTWDTWWNWSDQHQRDLQKDPSTFRLPLARAFGEAFGYPSDLTLAKSGFLQSRAYRFVRWQHTPLDKDEETQVRKRYAKKLGEDYKVTYPLMVVEPLPPKVNFLVPPVTSRKEKERKAVSEISSPREIYLDPDHATVVLVSPVDLTYATFLPSILRAVSISITSHILQSTFPPLAPIQSSILETALLAPVAGEPKNYQRLETLGDTVLKLLSSIQLFAQHPNWHEGYLAKRRDHSVANVALAKRNVNLSLFKWIIRDRLIGKKFKPLTFAGVKQMPKKEVTQQQLINSSASSTKPKKRKEELSTKVLADVVEAIIGAAYLQGNFDLALECCKLFDLGLVWEPILARLDGTLANVTQITEMPPQLDYVEDMLDYAFQYKPLLLEALTHASCQDEHRIQSYERLEFIGDAVIDMVVTDYVFRAEGKNYSPGHMHLRKAAMVNSSMLAFICLRTSIEIVTSMPRPGKDGSIELVEDTQDVYLWKCLLHHSEKILRDEEQTAARFRLCRESIEEAFENSNIFPWADLTRLQAPKFFSDVIESLIGAAYLDSRGDLGVVRGILAKLGWFRILERIVREDVSVLHPISHMSLWAQKNKKQVKYEIRKEEGELFCIVKVDSEEKLRVRHSGIQRGKASEAEVRLRAAEEAIKLLHLRN